jgi:hypothetical protein
MAQPIVFTKSLAAASATNIALSQSPGTAALTLNGAAVSGGVATIDGPASSTNSAIGRRVIIVSGGNDSAISFVVAGTNSTGNVITDTVAGTNAGTAQSNLDFVTVTSITPTGAGAAGTITAGTNGVGSSPWYAVDTAIRSTSVGAEVEIVSGAANYTVEYSDDDPNALAWMGGSAIGLSVPLLYPAFPRPLSTLTPAALNAAAASGDGWFSNTMAAIRLTVNSGTGVLRVRFVQSGLG